MASDSTFYHWQSFVLLGVVVVAVDMRFTESAIPIDGQGRQSPLQITQPLFGSRPRGKKSNVWRLVALGSKVHLTWSSFGV